MINPVLCPQVKNYNLFLWRTLLKFFDTVDTLGESFDKQIFIQWFKICRLFLHCTFPSQCTYNIWTDIFLHIQECRLVVQSQNGQACVCRDANIRNKVSNSDASSHPEYEHFSSMFAAEFICSVNQSSHLWKAQEESMKEGSFPTDIRYHFNQFLWKEFWSIDDVERLVKIDINKYDLVIVLLE